MEFRRVEEGEGEGHLGPNYKTVWEEGECGEVQEEDLYQILDIVSFAALA